MWISTKLGVDRFDGKNFRHYPLNLFPDQGYNRIGVNYLRCSPDSTLWVFSEAGLLFQYDERKDEFELIYAVRDFFNNHSIILNDVHIGDNCYIENCIVESRDTLRAQNGFTASRNRRVVCKSSEQE